MLQADRYNESMMSELFTAMVDLLLYWPVRCKNKIKGLRGLKYRPVRSLAEDKKQEKLRD